MTREEIIHVLKHGASEEIYEEVWRYIEDEFKFFEAARKTFKKEISESMEPGESKEVGKLRVTYSEVFNKVTEKPLEELYNDKKTKVFVIQEYKLNSKVVAEYVKQNKELPGFIKKQLSHTMVKIGEVKEKKVEGKGKLGISENPLEGIKFGKKK